MTGKPRGANALMLLVGTAKGLFRITRNAAGGAWRIDGPHLAGYSVLHTLEAPDGRFFAATSHKVWGAHIYASDDRGLTWTSLDAVPGHPAASARYQIAFVAPRPLAAGCSGTAASDVQVAPWSSLA